MKSTCTLNIYEQLVLISDDMLDAAHGNDWERLSLLESLCTEQIDQLRVFTEPEDLSESDRTRKTHIIHYLLERDREIRKLITPWMSHLEKLIHSNGRQIKLAQAYDDNTMI